MKIASTMTYSALALACVAALAACGGGGGGGNPVPAGPTPTPTPVATPTATPNSTSISPALVTPAAMSASSLAVGSMPLAGPDATLQGAGWTQIAGSATQVSASSDGSIWALSSLPAGLDKYLFHWVKGVWASVPGQASQIAAGPNGSLYAVNAGGGAWVYNYGVAFPHWTAVGGGVAAIAVAADGSLDAITTGGGTTDRPIWHAPPGGATWTQTAFTGASIVASSDWGTYTNPGGTVGPTGVYILSSTGTITYVNAGGTAIVLPGTASAVTGTTWGGAYGLAYPAGLGTGSGITFGNLTLGTWASQTGSAASISSDGAHLDVATAAGAVYQKAVSPATAPTPGPTLPPITYIGASSGNQFWGPAQSATAFNYPVQSGYNGVGITVAIVIDHVPLMSDMATYLARFGVVRTGQISERPVDGGGALDDAADGEATLDAETIAGIAPGANVIVYNIPDLGDQHLDDAYNAILSDGRAQVVSLSFGGCEYSGSKTIDNPIFTAMNAAGMAVVAASGDTGNACYFSDTSFPFGPQSPASDPNVIGVGGTNTINTPPTTNIVTNAIWNECATPPVINTNCVSGGGVSTFFTPPPYQAGLSGASSSGRSVPDIALPANNAVIRLAGQYYAIGGTSWSTPLAAGMVAEIYQYCNVTAMPNAVKMFYDTYNARGYAAFTDVTVGNDAYLQTPSYNGAAGYDFVGGIGQPNGMAIAQQICPGRAFSPLASGFRSASDIAHLAARARTFDNVRDLRGVSGIADAGPRNGGSSTRVSILLRATPTLQSDEQTVVAKLQAAGFTVTQRFRNGMLVDVEAPASVVARYFGTAFHDYDQPRFGTRFANVAPLVIPAEIAPYVQGVVSNNLVTKATHPQLRPIF